MKVYVLKLAENEYIETFDLANKEVSVIDDKYNAEHFHDHFRASYYADKFSCDLEELEIED
jgi:hypothetical protein